MRHAGNDVREFWLDCYEFPRERNEIDLPDGRSERRPDSSYDLIIHDCAAGLGSL